MGIAHSSPLSTCLVTACAGHQGCVAFPGAVLYKTDWARPYNLDAPVTPAAVVRPTTTETVSRAIKCASKYGVAVQPRCGGHSFANYGLGGQDGAVVIDLVNLKSFSMDRATWTATVGAGFRLGELDKHLHANGQRAVTHGTCPGVGVGGQAVVGGLGPTSRMWGNLIDHILEVEVVTADGRVQRASESQNTDLFWALRGAGASFAVITKLWLKTHPEPASVVEYTYDVALGGPYDTKPLFAQWQDMAAHPDLDRRFSSLFIIHPAGAVVTGTFYGTRQEFEQSGVLDLLPASGNLRLGHWLGSVAHQVESVVLRLADVPTHFYSKSLALRAQDVLSKNETDALFNFLGTKTVPMVMIFNTEGGAESDFSTTKSAFAHRDKAIMYQSYMVDLLGVSEAHKRFLDDVHGFIKRGLPTSASTYPGYIDMAMNRSEAQLANWGDMLPRLQKIKKKWDPNDVFRNPQSVARGNHFVDDA